MDATVMTDTAYAAGIVATGVIGSVFLFTWVRDVMSKWQKRSELDAINHAQALSVLGDIAGAGQAQTAEVADKGTTAVSK